VTDDDEDEWEADNKDDTLSIAEYKPCEESTNEDNAYSIMQPQNDPDLSDGTIGSPTVFDSE
jgi:hypothetical protein